MLGVVVVYVAAAADVPSCLSPTDKAAPVALLRMELIAPKGIL